DLYNNLDFDESYNYLRDIYNAELWEGIEHGENIEVGDFVYIPFKKDYNVNPIVDVYECINSHVHSENSLSPEISDNWSRVSEKIEFLFGEQLVASNQNSLNIDQLWGYKYYYRFIPEDIFGYGETKNLSENGKFGDELHPYICKVKIKNLTGVESGDSFLFSWDFVDENENKIDINDYKFTTLENSMPSLLGVRARIYDYDIIDSGNLVAYNNEFISIPGYKFTEAELTYSTINVFDGSTYEERTILLNKSDGKLLLDRPLPDTHMGEDCTYTILKDPVLKMTVSQDVISKIVAQGDVNSKIDFISAEAAVFDRFEYTRSLNNLLYDPSYGIGPYTERDDGGKRSITFEIVLVGVDLSYHKEYETRVLSDEHTSYEESSDGDPIYTKASQKMYIGDPLRITVDNPAPYILPGDEFRKKVDSLSETTKVKFNFNYALNFQERVTKINLYRIAASEVETYDADGNVISKDFSSFNLENNLVQVIEGPGNNTYGDNITQIIDIPPESQDAQGYYYRILPFDDFGSGVLYNVPNGPGADLQTLEKINIYPRSLSSTDPVGPPGKVLRSDPTLALGAVPGAPINFEGKTVFENYFLSWQAPQFDQDPDNPGKMLLWSENDIDHYEVWKSNNANEDTLKINDSLWSNAQNTGYRKVDGVIYTVGETPKVLTDPALNITNATNIFNVDGKAQKIETSYPGATREESHFWVRAVDLAGNKSPFTGAYGQDGVEGLTLRLNSATATDIDDFEISMTSGFADSIALVPNNPFRDNTRLNGSSEAGWISWPEHVLYNEGTGYIVNAGETDQGYVWWDRNNSSSDLNLENYTVKINGNEVQYNGQPLAQWQEFSYDDGDEW
ncbi:MAG: hypothetical protein EBY39_12220, partial [Flavobacteriia bacterium]|nr:hypothetical protein [Flavobacteriia bacterium]